MSTVLSQSDRERIEANFWNNAPHEAPMQFDYGNVINKMGEARILWGLLQRYSDLFRGASTILELGGGQLWASCIVKHAYPDATVMGSDIGVGAVASAPMWEAIFRAKLDRVFACVSYDIPLPDNSVDLIFAFQAAHHFGEHDRTFAEARRVLRPGGTLLYIAESVCGSLLYGMAVERARTVRDEASEPGGETPREDFLLIPAMRRLAHKHRFSAELAFRPELEKCGLKRSLYYAALKRVPALRELLPHASDFVFRKSP